MGRRKRGLYDQKHVVTGNNVSFSKRRTRRTFMPNVFSKRVFSLALDEWLHFRMSSEALRNIDKAGGVDAYLLAQPLEWLKSESEVGYAARLRIEAAMESGAPVAGAEEMSEPGWTKRVRRGVPPSDYVCMYTGERGVWKENSAAHHERKTAGFPAMSEEEADAAFNPYDRRFSGTH